MVCRPGLGCERPCDFDFRSINSEFEYRRNQRQQDERPEYQPRADKDQAIDTRTIRLGGENIRKPWPFSVAGAQNYLSPKAACSVTARTAVLRFIGLPKL